MMNLTLALLCACVYVCVNVCMNVCVRACVFVCAHFHSGAILHTISTASWYSAQGCDKKSRRPQCVEKAL